MTISPFMPPARALPILQELASCNRRGDLLSVMLDIPREDIDEALATACKELLIQVIVPRRPRPNPHPVSDGLP